MWRGGCSGANSSVVSPNSWGCSGGTHCSTALSGSRSTSWRRDDDGSSWGRSDDRGSEAGAGGRGGEERCTRGRKFLPSQVIAILEHEKEKKGGGGLQKIETGCEMKRKERKGHIGRGGGGGGGGGGRK